ncbi:hypothetical protein ACFQ3F_22460 [Nocardioides ginsengisoli]|uniref:Uncharacterized protein n=1 Tax=Nocardioides ginsengisoli TaxID=363868 RepID=A0ABW3W8E9_9ACTN
MLGDFATYDAYVDIVSAFEWLFVHSGLFAGRVRHFERFPKIVMVDAEGHQVESTPDFTLVFNDDTGLVGEIAKLALHENSVDKAVKQIGKYDRLDRLPIDSNGNCVPVTDINVMQIVPFRDGLDAVRRIIVERMLSKEHFYKPSKAPIIVQYDRDDVRYTFQRLQNSENGKLPAVEEPVTLGWLLDRGLKVRISHMVGVKATRKFMNDPIDPLYLATHLWSQHWPTQFPNISADVTVVPNEIAEVLRDRFGKCRTDEVRHALGLLQSAGLAADNRDGTWEVSRKKLRLTGEKDEHRIIALKAAKEAKPVVKARSVEPRPPQFSQDTLF